MGQVISMNAPARPIPVPRRDGERSVSGQAHRSEHVSLADQIRALEKAHRLLKHCWPTHLAYEREEVLRHIEAALVALGPGEAHDQHRICRRCGQRFLWNVAQQAKWKAAGNPPFPVGDTQP
jgi:hypothetical protein